MLKVFVGVLMTVAGITATELCREPIHRVCRDDDSPKSFPETAEEFQDFCKCAVRAYISRTKARNFIKLHHIHFALGFLRCGVKYTDKCDPSDEHGVRDYLAAFEGVCNEDTLLYAAIVDNLQCFNELRMKGTLEECDSLSPSVEILHMYAEAIVEEGYAVFSDDESEVNHTLVCIKNLQEMACYATTLEDKCGTIAMDAFVEIAQKFSHVGFCGETYHYLPTVLRVYKLQQEEANEISEIFKKRK